MIKRALIGVGALLLSFGAVASDYYNATGAPATSSQGSSATIRNEFAAIDTAMDKLPPLTGNGSEVVTVNSGGTALESTPYLGVTQGGTGAATLTDGGILLGSGTGAVTPMSVLTDGQIVVGDGTTDPTTLGAFTSSTGTLKHEYGGLEANVSAVADGDFVVGTGPGTIGLESGATARTTMGLGSIATQNSNAISVTGGSATGLTDLSTTNFSIGGTAVTATATEINYTDVTTTGTAQASKALVVDSNKEIESLGNIGIRTTIFSWDASDLGVLDLGSTTALRENSSKNLFLYTNGYFNGANDIYKTNGYAVRTVQRTSDGSFEVYTAPSGTAGNAITLTSRFKVANDGTTTINGNTAWHAGNDGAGSAADADFLDGISSAGFYQVSGTDVAVADGGTGASTINGARENLGIYHGRVNSAGTAIRLPSGWTSSSPGTGNYTVTHNLGTTNYTVVANPAATGTSGEIEVGINTNDFTVRTADSAGTAANRSFWFELIKD